MQHWVHNSAAKTALFGMKRQAVISNTVNVEVVLWMNSFALWYSQNNLLPIHITVSLFQTRTLVVRICIFDPHYIAI